MLTICHNLMTALHSKAPKWAFALATYELSFCSGHLRTELGGHVQVNLAVRAGLVLLLIGFARSLLGVQTPSSPSAWQAIPWPLLLHARAVPVMQLPL